MSWDDLVPSIVWGDLDLTAWPFAIGFGYDLGGPELVTELLSQQLQDGDLLTETRVGNRTLTLSVYIEGNELGALALAEARLAAERAKPMNTMTFNPGDGWARPTVFETFPGPVVFVRDDDAEMARLRRYDIEIPAAPWPRSVDPVTVGIPAPPATLVETPVADGSSLTGWAQEPVPDVSVFGVADTSGWTATSGWALSAVNSAVRASRTIARASTSKSYPVTMARSGLSVSTAGMSYLRLDNKGVGGTSWSPATLVVNGTAVQLSAKAGIAEWYRLPDGVTTVTSVSVTRTATVASGSGNVLRQLALYGLTLAGALFDTGSAALNSGRVELPLSHIPQGGKRAAALTISGLSVDLSTTPALRVTAGVDTAGGGGTSVKSIYLNGSTSAAPTLAYSGSQYWIDVTEVATLDSVRVATSWFDVPAADTATLWVSQILATNSTAGQATNRQQGRSFPVGGSVRAPASLMLHDAADAGLGSTLVYTAATRGQDAATPALRRTLLTGSGGAITPASDTCSGETSDLAASHRFMVPAGKVVPGGYLLLARVKSATTTTRTITWTAGTALDGYFDDGGVTEATTVDLIADTWQIITLGVATLPTTANGGGLYAMFDMVADASVILDEAWFFDVTAGSLTWVECGTMPYLWIDSATLKTPVPMVWVGNAANRVTAISAGPQVHSMMAHEFDPAGVSVYTVTSGSTTASVDLTSYHHWHTHAAD